MTGVDEQVNEHDLETPDSIQVRFGIEYVESDPPEATAVLSMPMHRFRNPCTDAPTVGPLAILVDAAAGIVNHYRRRPGQWTVSSELSMDLSPDVGDLDGPVLASAHSPGPLGATSLGICRLTYRGTVIGIGIVRSFFIDAGDVVPQQRPETLHRSGETSFADLMAVQVTQDGPATVLAQRVDRNLNNDIDIVHGGVAAAGLELAASAAINRDPFDGLLQTGSLRVNFLRPFFAGTESRYEGTTMRIGRNTGVSDAQAIGDDGKVAITARVTAYR
ncbi:PaaI family thioesterase [Mycobacterium parmense]|uniref:Phenylacetic acid degradation protein n=1 Tax=Mycobacterium parmense TaxID=185642 RepID=A0A7I7Z275_9MYCO|nr:PaaI family thioesterase [Mycobacterium parmense]MCV7352298.1 PaaI family thioesterase [Mycobacterium parmense]ORW56273.1 phenylacetic acid degradation protein [Mycobacterium parmense]BBZ47979.1 phenylacetic acid degradation protein [Mycobacterium parmense]